MLFSDGWKAYVLLGQEFLGYYRVNHSKEFVNYKEYVILPEKDVDKDIMIGNRKFPCHI